MNNHETTKEYFKLVTGFIDRNPYYDRGRMLNIGAKDLLEVLPQYEACLETITEASNRASFIQAAFLMEMERDNFPLENNASDMFTNAWDAAMMVTVEHFGIKARKKQYYKDENEFKKVFSAKIDSFMRTFLNQMLASDYNDMDIWLDRVYETYESKLIFG